MVFTIPRPPPLGYIIQRFSGVLVGEILILLPATPRTEILSPRTVPWAHTCLPDAHDVTPLRSGGATLDVAPLLCPNPAR